MSIFLRRGVSRAMAGLLLSLAIAAFCQAAASATECSIEVCYEQTNCYWAGWFDICVTTKVCNSYPAPCLGLPL